VVANVMNSKRTLPLGVDIGAARIRIARLEDNRHGDIRLTSVATRDLPESHDEALTLPALLGALIDEMREELGTRERRCIFALPLASAALRVLPMPKMGWSERRRAARFESQRIAGWDTGREESIVRVHPAGIDGMYAGGVARAEVVRDRVRALRRSGLRPVAADHAGCAALRAFPDADAVLDIGFAQIALHVRFGAVAATYISSMGGQAVTLAIARQLSIDAAIAERRKRILGTAGAGEQALHELVRDVERLVSRARERSSVQSVAVIGNGARLPGLLAQIEEATGVVCEVPVSELLRGGAYPDDIARSAAPDWTLAAALAAWGAVP
jgi:Tfp pilus assembly PilM family ATPase